MYIVFKTFYIQLTSIMFPSFSLTVISVITHERVQKTKKKYTLALQMNVRHLLVSQINIESRVAKITEVIIILE